MFQQASRGMSRSPVTGGEQRVYQPSSNGYYAGPDVRSIAIPPWYVQEYTLN